MKAALALMALATLAACAAASDPTLVTNICNLNWNYCPRDPGCITYDMSVKNVYVHQNGPPIRAEDIRPGMVITMLVEGITTMKSVSSSGSYRIYALDGKNMAAGTLDKVLKIDGNQFTIEVTFTVTADAIGTGGFFEYGLDVFQEKSGTDEAFCMEVASTEYVVYEENKPSPPFEMLCYDNGNGTFRAGTHRLHPKPLPSESCVDNTCDLDWYYCPRDPGCVTYAMTVETVGVQVDDSTGIKAGDHTTLHVNGTTHLKSISPSASYRIYDLAGHNAAAGVLSDVLTLTDCNDAGCNFGIALPFTLVPGNFGVGNGWFEFGLDVFQEKSETDEAFCIEVANIPYVTYEQTHTQPPPGFVTYCASPAPYGHFHRQTTPEIVDKVKCTLL